MTIQLPWPCPSAPPSHFSSSASSSHPGLLSNLHSGKVKFCLQQSSAPRCPLPGYVDWDWYRAGSSFSLQEISLWPQHSLFGPLTWPAFRTQLSHFVLFLWNNCSSIHVFVSCFVHLPLYTLSSSREDLVGLAALALSPQGPVAE